MIGRVGFAAAAAAALMMETAEKSEGLRHLGLPMPRLTDSDRAFRSVREARHRAALRATRIPDAADQRRIEAAERERARKAAKRARSMS